MLSSTSPGQSKFYLGDAKWQRQQPLIADQLNQEIKKLIGEPSSDKARRMQAVISVQDGVPFKSVRKALESISGGQTVITGEWQPYIRLFLIDGMRWSDPEMQSPFSMHGGVI